MKKFLAGVRQHTHALVLHLVENGRSCCCWCCGAVVVLVELDGRGGASELMHTNVELRLKNVGVVISVVRNCVCFCETRNWPRLTNGALRDVDVMIW